MRGYFHGRELRLFRRVDNKLLFEESYYLGSE
jgi:hypothetical protein